MSQSATTLSESRLLQIEKTALYEEALRALYRALDAAGLVVKELQESTSSSMLSEYDEALRKSLAQHRSVRYKDFEAIFKHALQTQKRRETELSLSVRQFLSEQTEFSQEVLREIAQLPETESAEPSEQARRTAEVTALMKHFAELQQKRREELLQLLREFRAEQEAFSVQLRACLAQAKELRLKDLKTMFQTFQAAAETRIQQTQARRKEVAEMLQRFKLQRLNQFKDRYARKNDE
ncbi:MAG: hypothetical protein CMR00_07295 [[Chlorobium] sp. 445]|nr:MAG: hypothetical protein CMR00_07295 [[Chlorobium] sp. 445]